MIQVRTVFSAAWLVCGLALPVIAQSAEAAAPPAQSWRFTGPFGGVDASAARRGFQIYSESCASCHSMDFLHYRDLAGIGFTPDQIKAIAAKVNVPAGVVKVSVPAILMAKSRNIGLLLPASFAEVPTVVTRAL